MRAVGTVYLLHFSSRYKHAGHYLGWTCDLSRRLYQHTKGTGARLMEVIKEAKIDFRLVRTWEGGRQLERRLKSRHSGVRLCPVCRAAGPATLKTGGGKCR